MNQSHFAREAQSLSGKFTGLARVMSGKYDWRPTEGVRSVADVFNLIVKENGVLAGAFGHVEYRSSGRAHHRWGSARAPGAVDRTRPHQRRGTTLVQVSTPMASWEDGVRRVLPGLAKQRPITRGQ